MKLVPLGDRVVLKQLEAEQTTKSGIVLPGQEKEKPQQAEVIAVGPGGTIDGKEVKVSNLLLNLLRGEVNQLNKSNSINSRSGMNIAVRKMLGIKNMFCKMYDDKMQEYRIEHADADEDDDDEELFNRIFGGGDG